MFLVEDYFLFFDPWIKKVALVHFLPAAIFIQLLVVKFEPTVDS